MAINLATAYVDIVAETRGLGAGISQQLGGLQGQATQAGTAAGSSFGSKFGKLAKVGILGAGALIAGALGASIASGINTQAVTTKLGAQLGASAEESGRLGKVAGTLYSQNYGDGLGDVTDSIKSVIQNIGGMATASDADLASITGKVTSLAGTFDQDLGATTVAVGQLMKTGLAKNAGEALDIITAGFQNGADKSGDFLDTLNEYGVQFSKLGISGATATGLISQGLQAGARDGDIVADAFKEFSIRAIDGSKTTTAAYASLGVSASKMQQDIAKGGPSAAAATQLVLSKLKAVKDPAEKAAIATALFGTQSEDLGKALFALDLGSAAKGLGDVAGAAGKVDKAVGGTLQAKLSGLKRSFSSAFSQAGTAILPAITPAIDGLGKLAGNIAPLMSKGIAAVGPVFSKAGAALGPLLTKVFGVIGPILTQVMSTVGPIFTQVFAAIGPIITMVGAQLGPVFAQLAPIFAQLLPLMNPFGLIFKALLPILPQIGAMLGQVAGILVGALSQALVGLMPLFTTVVGIIQKLIPFVATLVASLLPPLASLFEAVAPALKVLLGALMPVIQTVANALIPIINKLMPVVTTVFGYISRTIGAAMTVIKGIIEVVTGLISGNWSKVWDGIKNIISGIWTQIKNIVSTAIGLVKGVLEAAWSAIKGTVQLVWSGISALLGGIWTGITGVIRGAVDGIKGFLSGAWDGIKSTAKGAWDLVKSYIVDPLKAAYEWVTGVFGKIGGFFSGLWNGIVSGASSILGGIGSAVSGAFSGLANILKAPINAVIGAVNWAIDGLNSISIDIPSWIPLIGGKHFGLNIGHIPSLAKGGVMNPTPGGSIVRVAEAGQREIVTPEPLMRSVLLDALNESGNRGAVTMNVYQLPGQSPADLAREIDRRLTFGRV